MARRLDNRYPFNSELEVLLLWLDGTENQSIAMSKVPISGVVLVVTFHCLSSG